ncbi:hypothetical protein TNCV_2328031 [Trichonephila clavipes]|nr:hypothetical protein TNCV_2328031 [Trichonephila clavipes]
MSFTRRPGSGRSRQTSHPEDRHIKKRTRTVNCFIGHHLGTSSTFTKVHVSSRTIRRRLSQGHLCSRRPLRVLPLTSTHLRLLLE